MLRMHIVNSSSSSLPLRNKSLVSPVEIWPQRLPLQRLVRACLDVLLYKMRTLSFKHCTGFVRPAFWTLIILLCAGNVFHYLARFVDVFLPVCLFSRRSINISLKYHGKCFVIIFSLTLFLPRLHCIFSLIITIRLGITCALRNFPV